MESVLAPFHGSRPALGHRNRVALFPPSNPLVHLEAAGQGFAAAIVGCEQPAYERLAEHPQHTQTTPDNLLVVRGVFFVSSPALHWLRHRSFAQPIWPSIRRRELHHHTAK